MKNEKRRIEWMLEYDLRWYVCLNVDEWMQVWTDYDPACHYIGGANILPSGCSEHPVQLFKKGLKFFYIRGVSEFEREYNEYYLGSNYYQVY